MKLVRPIKICLVETCSIFRVGNIGVKSFVLLIVRNNAVLAPILLNLLLIMPRDRFWRKMKS